LTARKKKEFALVTSRRLAARQAKLAMCLAGVVGLSNLVGCSGVGSTTDLNKGFLDPTAVGRYQKEPLVVPILSSLDRNVDVPVEQFRGATDVRPEDLESSGNDYTIGRNDLISVSITDLVAPNVETVRTARVTETGMISLPLVGQIKATGLTEAQLQDSITKAYRDANLIQNAQVSVAVTEARARTFSIRGSVGAPGQYAILQSDFRLMDAIVLGRDITAQGIDYIYIIRPLKSEQAGKTPETRPATPTNPSEDVLTPHSQGASARPVILAQASPTTGAAAPMTDDDQKFITVEGKQVEVTPQPRVAAQSTKPANTPAVAAPSAPAAAVPPAPAPVQAKPAAAPTARPTVAPVAQPITAPVAQPFAFNDPVAEGKYRVIRVPYEGFNNGDLRYNVVIKPYDMIVVPQPVIGEYYMGGHVARVGVYSLTARKITLKEAVVSAGMFDAIALPARTDVVRRVGGDKEIFVSVDLDKVFAGEQPEVFLKPNDVVMVGTSWWAPFVAAVRGGFRTTYGFGFLYDRNFWDENTQSSNFDF
jgi:polysaccharide biosynthesis/export protein